MGLLDMLGGRPGDTIRLKKEYDMYAQELMGQGQPPPQWPQWLMQQGYQLGPDNLVSQMPQPTNMPASYPLR